MTTRTENFKIPNFVMATNTPWDLVIYCQLFSGLTFFARPAQLFNDFLSPRSTNLSSTFPRFFSAQKVMMIFSSDSEHSIISSRVCFADFFLCFLRHRLVNKWSKPKTGIFWTSHLYPIFFKKLSDSVSRKAKLKLDGLCALHFDKISLIEKFFNFHVRQLI